ncbi:oxygenase MpaB family protein [Amycolatopsis sp. NPDC059657]|uniref:oxygenase MpaB family protein n=1 Tax=Amycolatopsis sp. NPDC059657 TaxID=3346899 RepID=UPI00366CD8C3
MSVELLDSMRQQGDPLADAAVAEAFETGAVRRVNDLIAGFRRNGDEIPADLPPSLRRYFAESAKLPDWADRATIQRGRELWGRYGPHMGTILHAYSLPVCYGWAKAAQVLHRTTRIESNPTRRVLETAQFLQDVMVDGGLLSPDGYGLRSAQKIRLLHATIRYFLSTSGDWDTASLGLAANQEDLVATMGTFSVCIPRGLVKLGVDLPARDREDCFHVWSVVGHLIGVDPALMPHSFEEGGALMDTVWRRQTAESAAGKGLTAALIESMRGMLGPALRGAPPSLIRHLCGDELADLLGVPPADWTALAVQLSSGTSLVYGKVGDRSRLAAALSSKAGELLMAGALRASNRGNRYDWTVPESESAHHQG